ncbi:MAG TPA: YebC/PmpR family DNA-binding transcriptional regulator [Bacteroidales bacterium]|jgi:YebC/PmpR family DNA-binding regulatory protein|nr:YebC/PmpR family DNA-binding transcriptional regulator [Bacteroidales bacterium]HOS57504.1 YebC/PmpR family DNA-binding transcriptional regulator [Bacteroidales bacterium]HPY81474.1 YebC/PmpR family DNA-binding transcriptional regulator [Bacteroidales bacterium]HQA87134.1 YebC/PmpR family DNA-binding transcriptional regulator [Bacteroidales bacterium]HRT13176.1 YebC/PmpR family DNA-binding transcriptional regulator [Bacteroidales bacterium]
MGRAFEYRKARKFKRWGNMAKVFTRLGKEITMAAKTGGPDPALNSKLRLLMQNARTENMPKENVERAIKRAFEKDTTDYKEVVYEGYGPHGVAIVIEAATDNTQRTVANIRSYFNKYGGSLGTSGMLDFIFDRKCSFTVKEKENLDLENLELELIDYGVEEVFEDNDEIVIFADFQNFGAIQKYLEQNDFDILNFKFERIPNDVKNIPEDEREEIDKLLEKIEEDEDVTNVFHNME